MSLITVLTTQTFVKWFGRGRTVVEESLVAVAIHDLGVERVPTQDTNQLGNFASVGYQSFTSHLHLSPKTHDHAPPTTAVQLGHTEISVVDFFLLILHHPHGASAWRAKTHRRQRPCCKTD